MVIFMIFHLKKLIIKNDIVSFYLTQKGKSFIVPMEENPIWSFREIWDNDDEFTINLTSDKGNTFELDYFLREL